MWKYRNILLLIIVLITAYGCASKKKAAKKKIPAVKLYNPGSNKLHVSLAVYHHREDKSLLYMSFLTSEYLFNQANEKGEYLARVQVIYELTEMAERKTGNTVIDTFKFDMKLDKSNNKYLTTIPLNVKKSKKYFLAVYIIDRNSEKSGKNFCYIDKSSEHTAQNYQILSASSEFPLFRNIVSSKELIKIKYNKDHKGTLYVKYFKNEQPLPPPTFSLTSSSPIQYSPDSIYAIPYHDTLTFMLPSVGKYQFQFDTTQLEGVTLYNFGDRFPKFTHADDLIPPLAYLTNSKDYKNLLDAQNTKLAVDNYWYGLTGNMDIARELIKIYYNRATFSNYYFTCDRAGWKTDRGMIYMIYGLPDKVEKSAFNEKWMYFDKQNVVSIDFTFDKRNNPFTDNDFELQRDDAYDGHWRRAIETWRDGKIYILE